MNELMIFNNQEFGEIRTIEEDGKVLFCGSDVARALGYSNPRDAVNRHCKGVVKRDGVSHTTNQHGVTTKQTVEMSFIPESDLYRLVFSSKLPTAERFTDWVTSEVLPSIRKNGGYIAGQKELTPDELMAKALMVAQRPKEFVSFLLSRKYLYRDQKGKLMPYQTHVDAGLFELKECFNEKTQWGGTQTMVTPKGRETFRLLLVGAA